MNNQSIFSSIILSLGLALAGYFIGSNYSKARLIDRTVTVKGLSEQEVKADLAIWPITFVIATNDLSEMEQQLKAQGKTIIAFLKGHGLNADEISPGVPNINDTQANNYGGNNYVAYRYKGRGKITVQTTQIEVLNRLMENISDLLHEGIVIEQDEYRNRVDYTFTGLNDIKPGMIREATIKAREAAQQFAKDAGSKVGRIKRANQGYFSILDRDTNTPYIKKIRVVTTVEYLLEN